MPEQDVIILCDRPPHAFGWHSNVNHGEPWRGEPLPVTRKPKKDPKKDIRERTESEVKTGPPVTGTMLKERGMAQVEANAPEAIKDEAKRHLVDLAQQRDEFTSEDIIERMSQPIDEARLLGVIMSWGARHGYITKASPDRFTSSDRPGRHAGPVRVWVSLVRTP